MGQRASSAGRGGQGGEESRITSGEAPTRSGVQLLGNAPLERSLDQVGAAVALPAGEPLADELGPACLEGQGAEVLDGGVPVEAIENPQRESDHADSVIPSLGCSYREPQSLAINTVGS